MCFGLESSVPFSHLCPCPQAVLAFETYVLTYLLNPWNRVLLEKLTGSQLVQKFPTFYGTRKHITTFTSDRHLPLSWTKSIQATLYKTHSSLQTYFTKDKVLIIIGLTILFSETPLRNFIFSHVLIISHIFLRTKILVSAVEVHMPRHKTSRKNILFSNFAYP